LGKEGDMNDWVMLQQLVETIAWTLAGAILIMGAVVRAIKKRQSNNEWDALDALYLFLGLGGFILAIISLMK